MKKEGFLYEFKKNKALFAMAAPAFILVLVMQYFPMSGLVLEKWMNPVLFEGTTAEDEYYLPRQLPREVYEARIKIHRSEYITERDFVTIKSMGLDAVRIPVPYFIVGDREPFIGCIKELDNAFNWAERYGLQILIDLHTAPLSQNGFDNGGICGEWCLFNSLACGRDTKGGQTVLNGVEGESEEKKEIYHALAEAQLNAWKKGSGYFYWSYKLLTDTVNENGWVGWDSWDLGRCRDFGWVDKM